jgi:hypothetical protein
MNHGVRPHKRKGKDNMTTATKNTTASQELAEAEAARDQARDRVRIERQKVREFDAETERLRAEATSHRHDHPEQYEDGGAPKPGTTAAKVSAAIQERRFATEHPKYTEASLAFQAADAEVQRIRIERFDELVSELTDQGRDVAERLQGLWAEIGEACADYADVGLKIERLLQQTPGVVHGAAELDRCVDQWRLEAQWLSDRRPRSSSGSYSALTRRSRLPTQQSPRTATWRLLRQRLAASQALNPPLMRRSRTTSFARCWVPSIHRSG